MLLQQEHSFTVVGTLLSCAGWGLRSIYLSLALAVWSALTLLAESLAEGAASMLNDTVTGNSIGYRLAMRLCQIGLSCHRHKVSLARSRRYVANRLNEAREQLWQSVATSVESQTNRSGSRSRHGMGGQANHKKQLVITLIQPSISSPLYMGQHQPPAPGASLLAATASVRVTPYASRPALPGELEAYLAAGKRPQVQLWYASTYGSSGSY